MSLADLHDRLAAPCQWRVRHPQLTAGGRGVTGLAGGELRVSPSGLASWRSSDVNASITSFASKARLRLPIVICLSTPASVRRPMASLTVGKERSISSAVLAPAPAGTT